MPISMDHPVPIKSVKPPPFVFFATDTHSFWRYFWPFLSARQLILTLALTVVVAIVLSAVPTEMVGLRVRRVIVVCFVLGGIRELYERLPGKITIAAARGSARQLIPILEKFILELGYAGTPSSPNGDHIYFRPKSNEGLWRFISPKQNLELCIAEENIVEVLGAKSTLNWVKMNLRPKLGK